MVFSSIPVLSNDWEVRIDTDDGFGNSLRTPNYLGIDTGRVRTARKSFSCPVFSVSFLTSTMLQRLVQLERVHTVEARWKPWSVPWRPTV